MSSKAPLIASISEDSEGDLLIPAEAPSVGTDMFTVVNSATPFVKPKLVRRGSEAEIRMQAMRERFMMLQMTEDEQEKDLLDASGHGEDKSTPEDENKESPPTKVMSKGSARWSKLRKVVNWQNRPAGLGAGASSKNLGNINRSLSSVSGHSVGSPLMSFHSGKSPTITPRKSDLADVPESELTPEDKMARIELEDIELTAFFKGDEIPSLERKDEGGEEGIPNLNLQSDADILRSDMFLDIFNNDSKPLSVSVSRIPENVVEQRKAEIEAKAAEDRQIMLDKIKAREEDGQAREMAVKEELREKESHARRRLDAEKQKVVSLSLRKQRDLAQDYKRTREKLEKGIKRQQGAIKENFGHLLIHEETLARRFQAETKLSPQPIEFRIHTLRAVKNKLPKGTYCLMLTQYDSLGGRPLSWSSIGSNGIGNLRPGITRLCPHGGRFFDRVLRVEDSCFALCPSRPQLKPNFVFVLELFQLASRHNPVDKIEAWTAVPMTYESMSIIEGKMKLPLMRGEHSPNVQHFKSMERLMAKDLNLWLCNIYIEVRHMTLNELGASDAMLKSTDFDLDYFNKSMTPLDVDGNPVQQVNPLHEEREEFLADAEKSHQNQLPGRAGSMREKQVKIDEAFELEQPAPLYPVDKGIFRRKNVSKGTYQQKSAEDEGGGASQLDLEGGGGGGEGLERVASTNSRKDGKGQRSVSFSHDLESGKDGAAAASGKLKVDDDNAVADSSGTAPSPGAEGARSESPLELYNKSSDSPQKDAASQKSSMLGYFGGGGGSGGPAAASTSGKSMQSRSSGGGGGGGGGLGHLETPLLLKNDDNFLEHRKMLVKRWKENIQAKMIAQQESFMSEQSAGTGTGTGTAAGADGQTILRERPYNLQDEIFLHRQQRGKIAATETIDSREGRQWAKAGIDGKVVRRWQAEGPRFDSDSIALEGAAALDDPHHDKVMGEFVAKPWQELRDAREMEDYTMALASDPSTRKGLVPGAKSASKIRYIRDEMFGDFTYYLWGTFEFYMALGIYLFALWIRIYVHYLAQYLYLLSLKTPIYGFELGVFEIVQKYMSASISVAAEVGVVSIGPIANLCAYVMIVLIGSLFFRLVGFLPEVLSKFFAAFGFAAILDPILVIIIDLIYHNYNCTAYSDACKEDYTQSSCTCFNGDFVKLWYRMEVEEGSGLTGFFIVMLIYMGTIIIGSLLLYQYLIYVHRDGRILDQWRRINGTAEEFFIPLDFEVSALELKTVVHKGIHWRGPSGARRRLEITEKTEMDPLDPNYLEKYKKFSMVEIERGDIRSVFREFQLEPNGAIVEIFEAKKEYVAKSIFASKPEQEQEGGASATGGPAEGEEEGEGGDDDHEEEEEEEEEENDVEQGRRRRDRDHDAEQQQQIEDDLPPQHAPRQHNSGGFAIF